MNKTNYKLLIFVLAILSLLISGEKVLATVGGPTYISSIAFKIQDNSVYYTVHANDGRGCPPIVHKVNMITLEDSEVKSCDQFLQEFSYTEEGMQKYSQFIADTYQNLSYLGSVSLKKNNINIQVEFLSEHIEDGYTFWSEFRATLTQDNKEVAKIDFRGCAKEQPHVFEGYMIHNSDAMAILISNKGDCFEGGYVKEDLRIIKGIKYYDTNIVRSIKEESATEPNLANIIVYAAADDTENNDKTLAPQKSSTANIVLLVVTFILGTTLGYTLGKKRWKSQFPSFK